MGTLIKLIGLPAQGTSSVVRNLAGGCSELDGVL